MAGIYIGVCRLDLGLDDNFSLKGKRSVVRRVIQRTRNKFNVAMAEVGDNNDVLTVATLGFTVIGNERGFVNSMVDKIVDFVEELSEAPLLNAQVQIDQYG